jgi:hypothetical protein
LHFKNLKWSDGVCKNSFGKLNLKISFVSKHFERYDDCVSVEKEQLRKKKLKKKIKTLRIAVFNNNFLHIIFCSLMSVFVGSAIQEKQIKEKNS